MSDFKDRALRIIEQEEQRKADNEFNKLPPWVKESLEGDRLSDGSDEQEYDIKEQEEV